MPNTWQLPVLGAAFCLAGASVVCSSISDSGIRQWGRLLCTAALLFCAALSIPRTLMETKQFWGMAPDRVIAVTGTLTDDSYARSDNSLKLTLNAESVWDAWGNRAEAKGRVSIRVGGIHGGSAGPALFRGDRVIVPVSLYRIGSVEEEYLGFTRERATLTGKGEGFFSWRPDVQISIRNRLRSTGSRAGPLLEALLLGYRDIRSGELNELFRKCGAVHLLALSGMHLGVLSLGVLLVLSPVLGKKRAACVAFLAITAYLVLVGPRPSLVRAVIMYGCGVCGYLVCRSRPPAAHLLALSFCIQSIAFPGAVRSLGFQLSYLALGGILLFSGHIRRLLPFWIPPQLSALIAANASAILCTAPLLIKCYGIFYPAGLIFSLVLTPVIILWMWTGITYLLWSFLCKFIGHSSMLVVDFAVRRCMERAAAGFTELVRWMSGAPAVTIPAENYLFAAAGTIFILTLLIVSQYAGLYGAPRKLQLSRRNRTLFEGQWDGPEPPLWTELSHIPGSEGEDRRAA